MSSSVPRKQATEAVTLLLLSILRLSCCDSSSDTPTFCNCEYTIPEDFEPHCRAFGDFGVGEPKEQVPWLLATEQCVRELDEAAAESTTVVAVSTMTREQLWLICPFANSTNVNVQLLRNELQTGTSEAIDVVRAALPDFFQAASDNTYALQDSFLSPQNALVDCQLSESLCWSVIRDHLTVNAQARAVACQALHQYQKESLGQEQQNARVALCVEDSVPEACSELKEQISTQLGSLSSSGSAALSTCELLGEAASPGEILECDWTNPLPPPTSAAASLTSNLFAGGITLLSVLIYSSFFLLL